MDALPQFGRQKRRYQRAHVYGDGECRRVVQQLLLLFGQPELVAAEGEHARFDAARADGYQKQPEERDDSADEKRNAI